MSDPGKSLQERLLQHNQGASIIEILSDLPDLFILDFFILFDET